jgi:hypothetical protein
MTAMRKLLATCAAVGTALVFLAAPAGAQQIVDAGKEGDGSGGLAFVLMAVMVLVMGLAMFAMDRIRRRASDDDAAVTS